VQRAARTAEQRIARVFALENGGKRDTRFQHRGEVLQAVHGDINRAIQQGPIDFLGEKSAAADLPQRHIGAGITLGADPHELNGRRTGLRPDQTLDVTRLPQRQRRAAGPDAQWRSAHGSPCARKR
jgi:hypothetical protein